MRSATSRLFLQGKRTARQAGGRLILWEFIIANQRNSLAQASNFLIDVVKMMTIA